jgi:hypothetical protein
MIFPFKPAFCLGILQQAMTGTSPRHPFERRAASESVTGVREKTEDVVEEATELTEPSINGYHWV